MEATEEQESNAKGEKEHEKLLTRSNNGACSGQKYVEPADPGYASSSQNLATVERSLSYTSDTNREKSPGKDRFLSQIPEEDVPQADCKRKILKVVVTLMFIFIVVGVVVIWTIHEGRSKKHIGNQYFDFIARKRELNVYNAEDNVVLTGYLKVSDYTFEKTQKCGEDYYDPTRFYCFEFDDTSVFKFYPYKVETLNCINIIWEKLLSVHHIPVDCYDIEYGLWYGMPNRRTSFWPLDIETETNELMSYRPGFKGILGNVLENYWLSTEGVVIVAHQDLPLKVSVNSGMDKRLCLTLDADSLLSLEQFPTVNYSVCQGADIKETHLAARNYFLPKTAPIVYNEHEFSEIIWSYRDENPNHNDGFGEFLHKLKTADLSIGMVEYDTEWQEQEGNIRYQADILNEISIRLQGKYTGVKLMLPLSLACSYLSENFIPGVENSLFVKDAISLGDKLVQFKGKSCGLWDATNPSTRTFLKQKFELLQKADPLHPKEFPQAFKLQSLVSDAVFPITLYKNSTFVNLLNKAFINMLISLKKPVLLESAYRYQNRPVFVEIFTTVVTKDNKKCLDYLISGALTAGLHGYPWLVAEAPADSKIDLELFMRWLQVATFFPGVKIPRTVVNNGEDAISLTHNMSNIRQNLVIPEIMQVLDDVEKGVPIIRPMWWINPHDYKTLRMSDQFLIGSSLMVAPVLCHGERVRDIYLPEGTWVNYNTGEILEGRKWLRDFEVPLQEIPIFTAQETVTATTEKT